MIRGGGATKSNFGTWVLDYRVELLLSRLQRLFVPPSHLGRHLCFLMRCILHVFYEYKLLRYLVPLDG